MSILKSKMVLMAVLALPVGSAAEARFDSRNGICVRWDVSMYGITTSKKSLPFWAVTNRNGLFPDSRGGLVIGGGDLEYDLGKGWTIYGGTTLAASLAQRTDVFASPAIKAYGQSAFSHDPFDGKVGQLYSGIGWKALRLDLGIKDRLRWFDDDASKDSFFGVLSLAGGNMMWTGNARNLPGYNISSEYIDVPWMRGFVAFKFNYADYVFIDDRYVDKARLHDKSLYLKFRLGERVDFQAGLEHFAVWGGDSPKYGSQPDSFKDYLKVVLGRSGGGGATASDQENALGDHRGRELFQLDWRADEFKLMLAHDRPFEDGSGVRFKNFPDGVTTVGLSLNDRDKWVTDILYEYVFTRSQSGSVHSRPATEKELGQKPDRPYRYLGGRDDYFNNSEYASGWTNYGRTIGLALLTPMPVGEDGIVLGISSNRIRAHHFGMAGKIAHRVPYRVKATYSINYGNYAQRVDVFKSAPNQFSFAFELDLDCRQREHGEISGHPEQTLLGRSAARYSSHPERDSWSRRPKIRISIGAYADVGDLYVNNFGVTLRLSVNGTCGKW